VKSIDHNVDVFKSRSFSAAVTGMSMSVGKFFRYLQVLVLDKDAKIIQMKPPQVLHSNNPDTKESKLLKELANGDVCLVYIFLHVGKKGTPQEGKQEYFFTNWNNQSVSPTSLKSSPLSKLQEVVVKISCSQVNKLGTANNHITVL